MKFTRKKIPPVFFCNLHKLCKHFFFQGKCVKLFHGRPCDKFDAYSAVSEKIALRQPREFPVCHNQPDFVNASHKLRGMLFTVSARRD